VPRTSDAPAVIAGTEPSAGAYGDKVVVIVESEVNPTEDEGKVAEAITAMTGSGAFRRVKQGNRLFLVQEGSAQLLIQFRALLRRERILDAARRIMLHNVEDGRLMFWINKQVATVGHISFCKPRRVPSWSNLFHDHHSRSKLLYRMAGNKNSRRYTR